MRFRILLNLVVSAVLLLATAEYDGGRLELVETLEAQSYDWRMTRNLAKAEKNDDIVIVDIDRESLRELGAWPWSRDIFARAADRLLNDYNARMLAFSLPFPETHDAELRVFWIVCKTRFCPAACCANSGTGMAMAVDARFRELAAAV